jgi:hypothetical protein
MARSSLCFERVMWCFIRPPRCKHAAQTRRRIPCISAVTALPFSLAPSFGTVDEVDVFIDAQDGARLTVVVDDGTISHMFTPEERWIKGRAKTFARSNLLAVTCCTDPTGGTGCATFAGDVCPDDLTICWGDCGTE